MATLHITETTLETTTEKTTTTGKNPSNPLLSLSFANQLTNYQRTCFTTALNVLEDTSLAQAIVDYVMEQKVNGKIKNFASYVKAIVVNANAGNFTPLEPVATTDDLPIEPENCPCCHGAGWYRFVRDDNTLTERLECTHSNKDIKKIRDIKKDYGYALFQNKVGKRVPNVTVKRAH